MHPLNAILDKNEPKKKCDKSCDNFRFDHLDTACCLSSVFSVKKNELCAIHTKLKK